MTNILLSRIYSAFSDFFTFIIIIKATKCIYKVSDNRIVSNVPYFIRVLNHA